MVEEKGGRGGGGGEGGWGGGAGCGGRVESVWEGSVPFGKSAPIQVDVVGVEASWPCRSVCVDPEAVFSAAAQGKGILGSVVFPPGYVGVREGK